MEVIVIIDADETQGRKVSEILGSHHYPARLFSSPFDPGVDLEQRGRCIMILNLDTVSPDNRMIKDMKKKNPALQIIITSSQTFHPELKEAMRDHVYACLKQPLDPEELIYWVKSVYENDHTEEETPKP